MIRQHQNYRRGFYGGRAGWTGAWSRISLGAPYPVRPRQQRHPTMAHQSPTHQRQPTKEGEAYRLLSGRFLSTYLGLVREWDWPPPSALFPTLLPTFPHTPPQTFPNLYLSRHHSLSQSLYHVLLTYTMVSYILFSINWFNS